MSAEHFGRGFRWGQFFAALTATRAALSPAQTCQDLIGREDHDILVKAYDMITGVDQRAMVRSENEHKATKKRNKT